MHTKIKEESLLIVERMMFNLDSQLKSASAEIQKLIRDADDADFESVGLAKFTKARLTEACDELLQGNMSIAKRRIEYTNLDLSEGVAYDLK